MAEAIPTGAETVDAKIGKLVDQLAVYYQGRQSWNRPVARAAVAELVRDNPQKGSSDFPDVEVRTAYENALKGN